MFLFYFILNEPLLNPSSGTECNKNLMIFKNMYADGQTDKQKEIKEVYVCKITENVFEMLVMSALI